MKLSDAVEKGRKQICLSGSARMSDYISLADLQKMSQADLAGRWMDAKFPFDNARCSYCATQHDPGVTGIVGCGDHPQFRENAVGLDHALSAFAPYLERIYALRLFYRDFYASNPPELDAVQMESSSIEKGGHLHACTKTSA